MANCRDCRTRSHAPAECACLEAGRWCHGFHAATLDEERIRQWWGASGELGVGVSCGPAGLVVIDVDAHEAPFPGRERILPGIRIAEHVDLTGWSSGFHSLAVLAALRGRPNPADDEGTLRVRTPSGGVHVWYRVPAGLRWLSSVGSGTRRALAWQVDVRAHGSYIVAPGTSTAKGAYVPLAQERTPAELPSWLAAELDRTGHTPPVAVPAPRTVPSRALRAVRAAGGGRRDAERALEALLAPVEECGRVSEGAGFSEVLNRAAFTLGGLVAAGLLSDETVRVLEEAAVAARPGQERRISQIIAGGFAAGTRKPLSAAGRRS